MIEGIFDLKDKYLIQTHAPSLPTVSFPVQLTSLELYLFQV